MKFEGTIVKSRFRVGEFLGSGSFCHAYWATDLSNSEEVVIKFFFETTQSINLYITELHALKGCAGLPGIPILVDQGMLQNVNFVVTDYCGVDLMQMLFRRNMVIEAEALKTIAGKLITTLEAIHTQGFLHLDIKPDNILISLSGTSVTLIDYGFARTYIDSGHHKPFTENNIIRGNILFCSSGYLNGQTPSRKSDLESLAYTLIMIEKGSLPWAKCRGFDEANVERCLSLRENFLRSDFISTVNQSTRQLLTYALGLKYAETPNYRYLEGLFTSDLKKIVFYPRGKVGKGKFYPQTFLIRNKSERRVMPAEVSPPAEIQSKPKLSSKKMLILTENKRRRSCRDLETVENHRSEERKATQPDESGPSISMQLRNKIQALRVPKED